MSINKLRVILIVALVTVFTLAVCLLCSQSAYAASAEEYTPQYAAEDSLESEGEGEPAATPEETPTGGENSPTAPETGADGSTGESGTESVADRVRAYLQAIYGDDYEKYYNKIIENWGSVENFLLNASDNLPEEYRYKATELLTTVNAYIGVGADAVLLLCIGIYIICRVKKNKKISADLTTLKACDNQIETAQLAIIESQKAQSAALQLLLPGERFAGAVAALVESDKALDKAAEEVKKIV